MTGLTGQRTTTLFYKRLDLGMKQIHLLINFYLEGVLDNSIDEGILEAEGIISFISPYNEEGRRHEFPIALKDGKLQQSTMTQVFESYVVPCSVHSDCECEIIFSQEDFDINYRNICRWNMPASLEEVLQFLNPTYSYRKF